jgi:hypothetical protein
MTSQTAREEKALVAGRAPHRGLDALWLLTAILAVILVRLVLD